MNVSILRPSRSSSSPHAAGLLGLALVVPLPLGCFDPAPYDDPTATEGETGSESTSGDPTLDGSTGEDPGDSGSGGMPSVCGDGIVEGDEVCDDGVNNGSYGGCTADCGALAPHCGDGIVNGGEACDDGDELDGNGCNVDCVVSGTVLWTVIDDVQFGSVDSGAGVAVDNNGNIIVSGNSSSDGLGKGIVRQYSPDGNVLWSTDILGPRNDAANGMITALSFGQIVFGGNYDPGDGARNAWIRSLSPTGSPGWTETYASPFGHWTQVTDVANDDNDATYVIIEETGAETDTGYQTYIRKYLPNGSEAWTISQPTDRRARQLAIDGSGALVVTASAPLSQVPFTIELEKLDSDGNEIWSTSIESTPSTSHDVAASSSGELAVVIAPRGADERALLLDADGVQMGEVFPPPLNPTNVIFALHFDQSQAIILAGTTTDGSSTAGWVAKYSQSGDEFWHHIYDGALDNALSFDRIVSIATDSNNNVVATGAISDTPGAFADLLIAKHAP